MYSRQTCRPIWVLVVVLLVTTLPGCVPITPEQASMYGTAVSEKMGKVTGRVTGVIPENQGMGWDCKPSEMEFEYLYNVYEVGPDGAAAGSAHWRARPADSAEPWFELYVAVDCVDFVEVGGSPAAIYSGKAIKATLPECFRQALCDWEGQLKIGRVTDGGTGGNGDEIEYWQPMPPCFYPDEGVPLGCVVPEGAQESSFTVTGGDVVVQPS